MEEPREISEERTADPEATLLTPRFDISEEQTAKPVVPLAAAQPWWRGTLPVALLVASALFGGVVSIFAYRLYQQRHQPSVARPIEAPAPAAEQTTPAPELTAAVPAERAPVETARAETDAKDEPAAAEVERARRDEEGKSSERARESEERAREAARRDEGERRAAREPRPRLIDVIPAGPAVRVERDSRAKGDEANDYEVPSDERERPRQRRPKRRSVDRIRDIFEGPPPGGQ